MKDFDGDLTMLTDNAVLLRRQRNLPTLVCAQKKGEKKIPEDDDFIQSNIASFGNEVGQITNKGTSMYEVRSHFSPQSEEYNTLVYRIRCTQAFQQESIDKAKGIVSTPMPRSWYDRHAISGDLDEDSRKFYRSISADKKPYFMKYVYPSLGRQYSKYIKSSNKNAMRKFGDSIGEMLSMSANDLDEERMEFLRKYKHYMPVGMGDCVMNRICRSIESEFDGYNTEFRTSHTFDSSVLKTGSDYSTYHYNAIRNLMIEYDSAMREHAIDANYERMSDEDRHTSLQALDNRFRDECAVVCPDEDELCDIVVDLCYSREKTKQFAWKMCGCTIVKNLLQSKKRINFPQKDDNGDVVWKADRYSVMCVKVD